MHGHGGTNQHSDSIFGQFQETWHGLVGKGCPRHKDKILLRQEELRRFCGIVAPLRLHLENRELTDGFPFLLEIWEMPDDGNLLPANARRIHGE